MWWARQVELLTQVRAGEQGLATECHCHGGGHSPLHMIPRRVGTKGRWGSGAQVAVVGKQGEKGVGRVG